VNGLHDRLERENAKFEKTPSRATTIVFQQFKFYIKPIGTR